MGVLTNFLIKKNINLKLIEIDNEAVSFLIKKFPILKNKIISGNFIKMELKSFWRGKLFNYWKFPPYNISSQILFKTLENRHRIPFFCGMFQKEVAKRICERPGSKAYGILSVLCQIFYNTEYLFSVAPLVFSPPPKVDSGVIALTRKTNLSNDFNEKDCSLKSLN